jgi:hypothetical protein
MKTTNGLWYATMLVLTLALNTAQATPDVRGTASAIDEMLIQEKRPLMVMREGGRLERHWRKPIQLHRLVPIFSDMLAVEEATVRKALFRKRQKLSDMIFAHLLAEKSGLNFETVLRTHTNWLQARSRFNRSINCSKRNKKAAFWLPNEERIRRSNKGQGGLNQKLGEGKAGIKGACPPATMRLRAVLFLSFKRRSVSLFSRLGSVCFAARWR